ncbi:MAG: hypothetical protein HYY17_01160 [Planctomycetes bacterium]|nr:hypothetical protein [Planctomycetota bacterium]
MFYEEVLSALNARRVEYLVVGGVAVNLWGAQRMTHDLDLMVELSPANLRRFVTAMENLGYRPRVPVAALQLTNARTRHRWIREKGMLAFAFYHPANVFQVVDVLIADRRYARFSKRAASISAGPVTVPLVSIEDLITMKREAGRKQDRSDVAMLSRIRRMLDAKKRRS